MNKAVLIINLGSPRDANVLSVWKFLKEFLMDARVIDIPFLIRFFLVNFIIIPLRVLNSSKEYKKMWNKFGYSPIHKYTKSLNSKVNSKLGKGYTCYYAMRYQQPSLKKVLKEIYNNNHDELIILPLYPQYASASTGSTIEKCYEIISKWWNFPKVSVINHFCDNDDFINCFVTNTKKINYQDYDHILFSYHGLPERHVDKTYTDKTLCKDHSCEEGLKNDNKFCYKAMCYETTNLIATKLNLDKSTYSVTFQSRLDNKWLKPFTDEVLDNLLKENKKKLLVLSPAFVSDCLETCIEIDETYKEDFIKSGGTDLKLVPSLNDSDQWVNTVVKIVKNHE
ncbi:MAG: ferrochelatase [Cytophagia bacterium]|nr:ferrochelatase [Cytophagia bacterium]